MKIRRKQRETRVHAVKWAAVIILAALCFTGFWAVKGVLGMMDEWTSDLPSIEGSDSFNYARSSTVLAADGTTVLAEFQLENRDPLSSLDEISPYVIQGTVDTEDVRFYEHDGVDLAGIARAVVTNFLGGNIEGASTITQQLVKNTLLSDVATDITIERKIREMELALEMEKLYSKDEILLMYLNTINYGDGCYGIEAAAQHYFSKSADELTLAEAATLVGIPQSPSYLSPTIDPEACLERRNLVLDRMRTAGDITDAECEAAQNEQMALAVAPANPSDGIYAYPYFTSYVREWLLENYSAAEIFEGGLTIYTTLDVEMQEQAEAACEAQYGRMADGYEAALVAYDPNTGYVRAMVGGKDYYTDQYNIAVNGRPTGSSFKAFTLAAAIENGINPQTMADCTSPLRLPNGTTIENFNGIDYGWRTIASATAVSSNTGFVRLQEIVGTDKVIEMAHRLGIDADLPAVASLTLGVADISPLEMAQAYGVFATGGTLREPVVVERIVNHNGETIYQASTEGSRVLSPEVAYATTQVLQGVFSSGGTAAGYGLGSQPVAGKTGTSESFYDHWLVGYTPNLVCSTWIGERYSVSSSPNLNANALWHDFMAAATAGDEVVNFAAASAPHYTYTGVIDGFGSTGTPPTSDAQRIDGENEAGSGNGGGNTIDDIEEPGSGGSAENPGDNGEPDGGGNDGETPPAPDGGGGGNAGSP